MNERLTTTQLPTPVDTLTRQETDRSTPSTDSSVYSDEAAAWLDEFFDRTNSDTTDFPTDASTTSSDTALRSDGFDIRPPRPFYPTEEQPQSDEILATPTADTTFVRRHADRPTLVKQHDRSQDYPFRIYCTPESLQMLEHPRFTLHAYTSQRTDRPAPYREVSAQTIFGSQSTLVQTDPDSLTEPPLTDNALLQGFVLLLAVTYVLLLYHNMLDIRTLLSRVFHDSSAGSGERRFEDPSSSRYARFMRTTSIIGILFVGILVVKYSQPFIDELPLEQLSFAAEFVTSLAISAVFLLVIGFQGTLLRLVGALTLTQPLLTQLRQLRKLYFSTAVVLVSPALLLLTLSPSYTSALWFSLIVVALAVTLFLYLRETLTLFLAKKVSFVHWILYLCGIELFPVSLLWQLAVR